MLVVEKIIENALAEDIGDGDHTSMATIPEGLKGRAQLLVKEDGILCGIPVAEKVFHMVDPGLQLEIFLQDGAVIKKGDVVFKVTGLIVSILNAERLVLNFMQRLSGIATATHRMVQQVKGLSSQILDTRKTTPGLRELEKYAVVIGGGQNHRMGLFDMIMIKDNHVDYAGGIVPAIEAVHDHLTKTGKQLKIEIEVRNLDELMQVLDHGRVDRIMLDNFPLDVMKKAIGLVNGRCETEASGGIDEGNVRAYAETGVDFISIGALTHHIKSLDLSLKAVMI